jgi:hypothetical protein
MKKVKIMMTAIAVLAVVGGALAFKARTFGTQFCTRAVGAGQGKCETTIYNGKTTQAAVGTFYYTSTDIANCTLADCKVSARLTNVEP